MRATAWHGAHLPVEKFNQEASHFLTLGKAPLAILVFTVGDKVDVRPISGKTVEFIAFGPHNVQAVFQRARMREQQVSKSDEDRVNRFIHWYNQYTAHNNTVMANMIVCDLATLAFAREYSRLAYIDLDHYTNNTTGRVQSFAPGTVLQRAVLRRALPGYTRVMHGVDNNNTQAVNIMDMLKTPAKHRPNSLQIVNNDTNDANEAMTVTNWKNVSPRSEICHLQALVDFTRNYPDASALNK